MRLTAKVLSGGFVALFGAGLLSACGEPKHVAVNLPPPIPRAPVAIPPRPYPPMGAAPSLTVPVRGPDGVRLTVNTRLTPTQTVWNLRSAYNVAALNCLRPQHAEIVVNYRAFLRANAKVLTTANRGVDSEFRQRYGAAFIRPREAYMTQVYNYFANPPTLSAFCDAALTMSQSAKLLKPAQVTTFSAVELPKLEQVFENFYLAYEQYRSDAAIWDARYAPKAVPGQVGTAPPPIRR